MKTLYLLLGFSVIIGLTLLATPLVAPSFFTTTKTATMYVTDTTTSLETHLATTTQFRFPCKGRALCWEGTVTHITDGDTLEVDGTKIRLALVTAPEMGKPGGLEAKSFVEKLCPMGSKVIVDQDDKQPKDSYGRVVGLVWCGDKNLNAELLYAGLAKIDTTVCSRSEFQDEDWAKKYGCH
jgi:micrococcal nuclease